MTPFWHLEFWCSSLISGKFVHTWFGLCSVLLYCTTAVSTEGMNGVALLKLLTLLLLQKWKCTWGQGGRKWKAVMGQMSCTTLLTWYHWCKDMKTDLIVMSLTVSLWDFWDLSFAQWCILTLWSSGVCGCVVWYCFRGTWCFHLQGRRGTWHICYISANMLWSQHLRRRVSDFSTFTVMIIPIFQSTQYHIPQDCTLFNFF